MSQGSLFDQPDQKPARRTRAPKEFSPPQMRHIEDWAERTVPWVSRGALEADETIPSYVEEALDYWLSSGRLKADWIRTVQNRIRHVERDRLRRLVRIGNDSARRALRDPSGWALDYDTKAKLKPVVSSEGSTLIRPVGGRVIHLGRQ